MDGKELVLGAYPRAVAVRCTFGYIIFADEGERVMLGDAEGNEAAAWREVARRLGLVDKCVVEGDNGGLPAAA